MAEEEKKVNNNKLEGWKRLILILCPILLGGLAIFSMIKVIFAWGPDFTCNQGEAFIALGFICAALLLGGLVMQWVWPKAITKGHRVIPVAIVFNIIFLLTASITSIMGYAVEDSRHQSYEARYLTAMKATRCLFSSSFRMTYWSSHRSMASFSCSFSLSLHWR